MLGVKDTIQQLKNNKTPGKDGIGVLIGRLIVDSTT